MQDAALCKLLQKGPVEAAPIESAQYANVLSTRLEESSRMDTPNSKALQTEPILLPTRIFLNLLKLFCVRERIGSVCSALGMGVSTRLLSTDEAARCLKATSHYTSAQ